MAKFFKVRNLFKTEAPKRHPALDYVIQNVDPADNWTVVREVGDGAFGKVHLVQHKDAQHFAAEKMITLEEEEKLEDYVTEIEILTECKHANVVGLLETYFFGGKIWMLLEYCSGGAVDQIMYDLEHGLTESQIRRIMREMLSALAYLHSCCVIHRDLKASNILLTDEAAVKLSDFGVSAKNRSMTQRRDTFIGTPYWMAPEVMVCETFKDNPYDVSADIWSLGVTAIELAQMEPPNHEVSALRVLIKVQKSDPPTLSEPRKWSPEFSAFLRRCLRKTPSERSSARELMEDAFVTNATSSRPLRELLAEARSDYEETQEEIPDDRKSQASADSDLTLDGGRASSSSLLNGDTHSVGSVESDTVQMQDTRPSPPPQQPSPSSQQVPHSDSASECAHNAAFILDALDRDLDEQMPDDATDPYVTPPAPLSPTPSAASTSIDVSISAPTSHGHVVALCHNVARPCTSQQPGDGGGEPSDEFDSATIPLRVVTVVSDSWYIDDPYASTSQSTSPQAHPSTTASSPPPTPAKPHVNLGTQISIVSDMESSPHHHHISPSQYADAPSSSMPINCPPSSDFSNVSPPSQHENTPTVGEVLTELVDQVGMQRSSESSEQLFDRSSLHVDIPDPVLNRTDSSIDSSHSPAVSKVRNMFEQKRASVASEEGSEGGSLRRGSSSLRAREWQARLGARDIFPQQQPSPQSPPLPSSAPGVGPEFIGVVGRKKEDLRKSLLLEDLPPPPEDLLPHNETHPPSHAKVSKAAMFFMEEQKKAAASKASATAPIVVARERPPSVTEQGPPLVLRSTSECVPAASPDRSKRRSEAFTQKQQAVNALLQAQKQQAPLPPQIPKLKRLSQAEEAQIVASTSGEFPPPPDTPLADYPPTPSWAPPEPAPDYDTDPTPRLRAEGQLSPTPLVSVLHPQKPPAPPPRLSSQLSQPAAAPSAVVLQHTHVPNAYVEQHSPQPITVVPTEPQQVESQDGPDAAPDADTPVYRRKKPADEEEDDEFDEYLLERRPSNRLLARFMDKMDRGVQRRRTVTKRTRVFMVDGVRMETTTYHAMQAGSSTGDKQRNHPRRTELQEIRRVQKAETRQNQELQAKFELERRQVENRHETEMTQCVRQHDADLDLVQRRHKKQIEDMERSQDDEIRGFTRRGKGEQEKELKLFRDNMKQEFKLLKQEADMLPKSDRKEAYKQRKVMLERDQQDREARFIDEQSHVFEQKMTRIEEQYRSRIALCEQQCLQNRHQLQRDREKAVWELEQKHILETHQLRINQIKEYYYLQRSQMLSRHQRETEHLKKTNAMEEDDLSKAMSFDRKRLPRDLRGEAKTRTLMFKEQLRMSAYGSSEISKQMKKFEENEKERHKAEIGRQERKHAERLANLKRANEQKLVDLDHLQNEKRKQLLENESLKIKQAEEDYASELHAWYTQLKPRKEALEEVLALEVEKLEEQYSLSSNHYDDLPVLHSSLLNNGSGVEESLSVH